MLQQKDTKTTQVKVFHQPDFEGWMAKLPASDYRQALVELDRVVDGNTTFDTNQLKGAGFNKVMQALAGVTGSEKSAREFLEMILMDHLIQRSDKTWAYERERRDRRGENYDQEIVFEVLAVTPN